MVNLKMLETPPTIITAVCTTAAALCSLFVCFGMLKSKEAPDLLVLVPLLVHGLLLALAVLQWVFYFRAYVDFQVNRLRQELQGSVAQRPPAASARDDAAQ